MKLRFLLFMGVLICFSAFLQAQSTDGTMTFNFTHSQPGSYSEDFLAVWVEHSDGTFIKAKMRYAQEESDHLPDFAVRAGGTADNCFNSNIDVTDAVTGATRTSSSTPKAWDTYMVVWDGKNMAGSIVPDGIYKMFVESSWIDGDPNKHDYINTGFSFTKGTSITTTNPANDTRLTNMTITWTPTALSLDSVYKTKVALYPNPSNGILNVLYKDIPVSKIDVVNFLGQIVKSIKLDPSKAATSQKIDLRGHATGLYIVNVSTNETSSSYKVVLNN